MPKYKVFWSKTYVASGTVEIEADNVDEASKKALDNIGDYTGSLQHASDDDYVDVMEV